jgi:hypothetical protein
VIAEVITANLKHGEPVQPSPIAAKRKLVSSKDKKETLPVTPEMFIKKEKLPGAQVKKEFEIQKEVPSGEIAKKTPNGMWAALTKAMA